jgi:prefoldin subunit 5
MRSASDEALQRRVDTLAEELAELRRQLQMLTRAAAAVDAAVAQSDERRP